MVRVSCLCWGGTGAASTITMESFSFAAPTRVRVLVVPAANISAADFDRCFATLRSANDIRLLDVSAIPNSRFFNPQTFPQGHVFYDYTCRAGDDDSHYLHDFEPFRKTFVVVSLGMFDERASVESLKEAHPTAIAHACVMFGSPEDHTSAPNCFYITDAAAKVVTSIETVACGITEIFLLALDAYASSYENITLRSPVSLMDGNMLTRTINYAQKRLSAGSSLKVSFSNGQGVHPATQKDLKLRTLQRHSGRQAKLMGNFFLLAGRCNDALQYFTDAAINCKKADDYLWLASALEGLAVASLVLLFLDLPHHVHNPMLSSVLHIPKSKMQSLAGPTNRASAESLPSRHSGVVASPRNSTSSNVSLGLPSNSTVEVSRLRTVEFLRLLCLRASQFYQLSTSEMEDCVPDVVYVESLIRNIKFMIAVYLSGGDNIPRILEAIIRSKPVERGASLDASPIQKGEIVLEIEKVFSLQLVDLGFAKQCHVYCALASIYSDLGLYRKQAFTLRILLVALLPKVAAIEESHSLVGICSQDSIRDIFELLFRTYKIDAATESSELLAYRHYSDWSTLQLRLIKICLRIAEGLRDHETLAKLCVLSFSRYSHCLPREDQLKLRERIKWLSLVLSSDEKSVSIPHPDPFLVRECSFVPSLNASELTQLVSSNVTAEEHGKESTVFNPYLKKREIGAADTVVCVNEIQTLKIEFQNPFLFDFDITDIEIVTDGEAETQTFKHLLKRTFVMPLTSRSGKANGWNGTPRLNKPDKVDSNVGSSHHVTVPSSSFAQILMAFKPLTPGELCIVGFKVSIANSKPQLFHIMGEEQTCALQKSKYVEKLATVSDSDTLSTLFENLTTCNTGNRVLTKSIKLLVIPPQPTLSIVLNLITSGWIMLLEGEKQIFSLKLRNEATDSINYLSFSFWDSTTEAVTAKLNLSSSLSNYTAEDIYELEWELLKNKGLRVKNKAEIASKYSVIHPDSDVRIDCEITGKRGMTELRLVLEYGNKKTGEAVQSYVKNVIVPLNISVYSSLEIVGCDILPIFSSSLQGFSDHAFKKTDDLIQKNINSLLDFMHTVNASETDEISNYCFLVLDVRNLWKDKLRAHIVNVLLEGRTYEVEAKIELTKTARFILPVRRIEHHLFDISKPIPSLRNKQFVKNYNVSELEEQQSRLLFWVKDILLKNLRGSWSTVGTNSERSGEFDLRCIRFSSTMTNSLIFDSILIQHSIYEEDSEDAALEKKNNHYILEREKFYKLRTVITNSTNKSISGTLRHIPFPVHAATKQDRSIEQKILYNGVLERHIGKDEIAPGEKLELQLGFLLLEKGQYEWGCIFDVSSEKGTRVVGREPVYITAL